MPCKILYDICRAINNLSVTHLFLCFGPRDNRLRLLYYTRAIKYKYLTDTNCRKLNKKKGDRYKPFKCA